MNRRNWLVLILMMLIGVGIIGYSLRTVNLRLLVQEVNTLNWGWMLVAFLCICLYLGLEGDGQFVKSKR